MTNRELLKELSAKHAEQEEIVDKGISSQMDIKAMLNEYAGQIIMDERLIQKSVWEVSNKVELSCKIEKNPELRDLIYSHQLLGSVVFGGDHVSLTRGDWKVNICSGDIILKPWDGESLIVLATAYDLNLDPTRFERIIQDNELAMAKMLNENETLKRYLDAHPLD